MIVAQAAALALPTYTTTTPQFYPRAVPAAAASLQCQRVVNCKGQRPTPSQGLKVTASNRSRRRFRGLRERTLGSILINSILLPLLVLMGGCSISRAAKTIVMAPPPLPLPLLLLPRTTAEVGIMTITTARPRMTITITIKTTGKVGVSPTTMARRALGTITTIRARGRIGLGLGGRREGDAAWLEAKGQRRWVMLGHRLQRIVGWMHVHGF